MDRNALVSELVGESYPVAAAVEGGRLRRNWIARSANVLPVESALREIQAGLEEAASKAITEAYSSAATTEALSRACPSVTLVRLDDFHIAVRIEFASPEQSVGDAAATSQWGVLQGLDRKIRLDELQGIPCEHWFPLRMARKAGSQP
jgi:hypothetical protein